MGIFSNIMNTIFGHHAASGSGASQATGQPASTFFMELPMVRKNYAPDENAPRQPYADKDAGVG
ncbi:hypothetical protein H3V53_32420, partial [Paraburkholderia bengalensis]